MLLAFVLAAAVQVPAAAPPAPPPPVAAFDLKSLDAGPYRDDALRLAEQVMPAGAFATVFETALVNGLALGMEDKGAAESLPAGMIDDLEKEVVAQARPHIARIHRQTLLRFARLFSAHFSQPEIADLAAFYRSPVGRKLTAMKFAHVATKDALREIAAKDETTVADINRVNRDAALKVIDKLDADDFKTLGELAKRPVFRKMATLKPMVDNLEAASANEPDPELEMAVERAVQTVLKKYDRAD